MPKQNLSNFTYANHVKLIKGGVDFFQQLTLAIEKAERTIYFQIYIFDEDGTGRAIANVLMAAAQRKVKVYLLLDGFASQGLSSSFIQELKDSGIYFRWFKSSFKNKKFYLGRRLHHKVIVIDSIKSFVCGMNISDRYNDTPESIAWLDWALYTEGAASIRLEQVCKRRIKDYSSSEHPKQESEVESGKKCAVKICINDWVARKSEVTKSYLSMLNKATSSVIMMSPYFLPGYQFRRSLVKAVKNGARVQVIVTGVSDIFVAKYAERYMYDWLLRNGIEIHEYKKHVLHGKIAVCDGQWVSVGSYNVNNLSAYASIELNMEVKNEEFASYVERQLVNIIKMECVQITMKMQERDTNFLKRMLHALAYNFLRFMLFLFAFKQQE